MAIAQVSPNTIASDKIDSLAVDGLGGVSNSLAYRVAEIERHLHSGGRWFGAATVANLPTHAADRIGVGVGAFRIDAGDNDWGTWVQIVGSTDTPVSVGKVYFDPHEIIIEDVERASTYFVQIGRGATGDAALTAGTYTELVYAATNTKSAAVVTAQTGRAPAGSLLWARCVVPGVDTGWMDFYIGLHEYEG